MTRTLTQPIRLGAQAIEQNIPKLMIELAFVPNPDGAGTVLDLSKTAITYEVQSFDSEGKAVHGKQRVVFNADWPADVEAAVRAILRWAETDAESAGILQSGTDKADL